MAMFTEAKLSYIDKMNSVFATCCVLHNICEIFQENFDDELLSEADINIRADRMENGNYLVKDAENIINALVQYCQDVDV